MLEAHNNNPNETQVMPIMDEFVIQDVLDFWFDEPIKAQWFNSTPQFDNEIRQRFQALWQAVVRGECESWLDSAEGCLAMAIVLDQFPLNMYRGMALSFSSEAKAIAVSKQAIDRGYDKLLATDRLAFLYMPLMHSEDLADQERAVKLFEAAGLASNARFARHHRDLIRQFGRFPHRNEIIGRQSTQEEIAYLQSKQAFLG